MTKLTLPSRAAATAAAAFCACLLTWAFAACPAGAFSVSSKAAGGENAPLTLNTSTSGQHTSSGGASLVRTIVGLAIVIAVIWGLSWILRQVKSSREPSVTSAGLASVAALTLSSGRSLHLVRAGSDYVLLGSAEHGVVPIHRYTEEEARAAGLLEPEPAPQRSRFPSRARQLTAGSATTHSATAGSAGASPSSAGRNGSDDPMRMSAPSSGLVERVREWTVRR